MNDRPNILKRLGVGFLYGLGFTFGSAVVLIAIMFFGASWFTGTTGKSVSIGTSSAPHSTKNAVPAQFAISGEKAVVQSWGGISILGTIENKGEDTSRFVNVYADLFDSSNQFMYQCMKQFTDGLKKAEKINFMIECHGLPKEIAGNYASFKVHAR